VPEKYVGYEETGKGDRTKEIGEGDECWRREKGNESQCRCCMYVGFDDGMRFWWNMKMCFLMVWLLERVVFRVTDFLLSTQLASSKVEE